ncbi:MAG: PaaI family thioesterase [Candidatus Cloacimonetes bacterium]|nr:PaaI family thioesterase [Candidatus Cloacimonadota bacterium]
MDKEKTANEYKNCFLCGNDNPIGLKLQFEYLDGKAFSVWTTEKKYEGFEEIIHGGIIASLLDEAIAKIIMYKGNIAYTRELNVIYQKPLPIGIEVVVSAELIEQRHKLINGKAIIYQKNNPEIIFAKGEAKFFIVS